MQRLSRDVNAFNCFGALFAGRKIILKLSSMSPSLCAYIGAQVIKRIIFFFLWVSYRFLMMKLYRIYNMVLYVGDMDRKSFLIE